MLCKAPRAVEGKVLYDCMVAWYKEKDTMIYDPNNSVDGMIRDYKHVIAEIDPDRMRQDPEYFLCAMKKLLDKQRVDGFLENALKTEEELAEETKKAGKVRAVLTPHGRYVGGVTYSQEEKMWKKGYDVRLGEIMHNIPEMKAERAVNYKRRIEERKKRNQERAVQIAKLQREMQAEQGEGR